jgi:predicted DNA-binding transcriptional regulator YafY
MLGTDAEVLEPKELRGRIAAASRGMAARYG